MSDPIDWPAMGMPEGVNVEFTRNRRGPIPFKWCVAGWSEYGTLIAWHSALDGAPKAALDGDDLHVQSETFPILEALMRAARAIEAGEVELNPEDSDHA